MRVLLLWKRLQQADRLLPATPAGYEGESTAPVTSTPVADRKAPQAGTGEGEALAERLVEVLGEVLDEALACALREPLGEEAGAALGESEGSGGPT